MLCMDGGFGVGRGRSKPGGRGSFCGGWGPGARRFLRHGAVAPRRCDGVSVSCVRSFDEALLPWKPLGQGSTSIGVVRDLLGSLGGQEPVDLVDLVL